MKQEKMFAVIKKPGAAADIRLLDKDPKTFTGIIEGKREIIPFPRLPGVCIVFDAEALQTNKKPNCFLPEYSDLILGAVIFAGINIESGFVSLTEEQTGKIEEYIKANDAKGFAGNAEERVALEYLPLNEENYVFGMLCEVKTKYKNIKLKWMNRR